MQTAETNAAPATLPPLIPRAVLFGNPKKAAPSISPDGKLLAYLAPDAHDVLAIWVRTVGANDDRIVASDPQRPIRNVFWQGDSRHVFFEQDRAGDENFHVFQADIGTGECRDLTPYPGVKAGIQAIDVRYPDWLLVYMNKRDPKLFDVHKIDLLTGELTTEVENPGNVSSWLADNEMQIRAALATNSDGSYTILARSSAAPEANWRTIASYSVEDGFSSPQAFSEDNVSLYVVSPVDANAARLLRYDIITGTADVIAEDPTFDVQGIHVDEWSRKVVAANIERDRSEWELLDTSFRADLAAIHALHPGDFSFGAQSADGNYTIVTYVLDDGPTSYYLYNRSTRNGEFLFTSRPELEQYTLAEMEPITYRARDGLTIHGYLTLPPGMEPHNLPMVLLVHGGPWARDSWGFNPDVQWLANRGYAVLQPNFRGSTGYGKDFINKGDRAWASGMRTDLLDAKDWAVARGVADPARVAIMGGSYGGYATLAALAFSPDAFACGVDIVGPSNLNTLLRSIPPYWQTERMLFVRRMGEEEAFLNSQSPLFRASSITAPLMIAQGAHDPRVNIAESDQIVSELRKQGKSVQYAVFEDEGHGFARPENNRRFVAAVETFLAKYLGGRVEPPSDDEDLTPFLR